LWELARKIRGNGPFLKSGGRKAQTQFNKKASKIGKARGALMDEIARFKRKEERGTRIIGIS